MRFDAKECLSFVLLIRCLESELYALVVALSIILVGNQLRLSFDAA